MGLLTGKKALVSGVANPRSIAWGIAQAFHERIYKVILNQGSQAVSNIVEAVKSKTNGTGNGVTPPK